MKRYLVFEGYNYYPCGGGDDFASAFDSLEEAKQATDASEEDWAHVWDNETQKIVYPECYCANV
jgi:hypothetical protein